MVKLQEQFYVVTKKNSGSGIISEEDSCSSRNKFIEYF